MPTEKKPASPAVSPVVKGSGRRGMPPIRPRGCQWEMWGGAVGIDHGLVVWDVSTKDGSGMAVGFVTDLPPASRRALARYMIALWKRFEVGA